MTDLGGNQNKKTFPWGWVAVGCSVAILGVIALGVVGFFALRSIPGIRDSITNNVPLLNPSNQPSGGSTTVPKLNLPGGTSVGSLPFTIQSLNDPSVLGGQSLMEQMVTALKLNSDTDFQAPKTYKGSASLDPSSGFTLGNGWCAKDDATLKSNLAHIQYQFSIDNTNIDLNKYPMVYFTDNQGHSCAATGITITPTAAVHGSYQMKLDQKFLTSLDDGITSSPYPAGDISFDFSIEFSAAPTAPGTNM
ncbi:MAG: hypothetical protein PHQ40_18435 [Anaerolineaceae bacterium]|nr:hypothetical protein [Anaerolineaceae bacterium]